MLSMLWCNQSQPCILEFAEEIRRGNLDMSDSNWMGISQAAQDTVKSLVRVDPQDRMSMEQLLQSSWLNGAASAVPISGLADRHKLVGLHTTCVCLLLRFTSQQESLRLTANFPDNMPCLAWQPMYTWFGKPVVYRFHADP